MEYLDCYGNVSCSKNASAGNYDNNDEVSLNYFIDDTEIENNPSDY